MLVQASQSMLDSMASACSPFLLGTEVVLRFRHANFCAFTASCSATLAENLTDRRDKRVLEWYTGPTLVAALDKLVPLATQHISNVWPLLSHNARYLFLFPPFRPMIDLSAQSSGLSSSSRLPMEPSRALPSKRQSWQVVSCATSR